MQGLHDSPATSSCHGMRMHLLSLSAFNPTSPAFSLLSSQRHDEVNCVLCGGYSHRTSLAPGIFSSRAKQHEKARENQLALVLTLRT